MAAAPASGGIFTNPVSGMAGGSMASVCSTHVIVGAGEALGQIFWSIYWLLQIFELALHNKYLSKRVEDAEDLIILVFHDRVFT